MSFDSFEKVFQSRLEAYGADLLVIFLIYVLIKIGTKIFGRLRYWKMLKVLYGGEHTKDAEKSLRIYVSAVNVKESMYACGVEIDTGFTEPTVSLFEHSGVLTLLEKMKNATLAKVFKKIKEDFIAAGKALAAIKSASVDEFGSVIVKADQYQDDFSFKQILFSPNHYEDVKTILEEDSEADAEPRCTIVIGGPEHNLITLGAITAEEHPVHPPKHGIFNDSKNVFMFANAVNREGEEHTILHVKRDRDQATGKIRETQTPKGAGKERSLGFVQRLKVNKHTFIFLSGVGLFGTRAAVEWFNKELSALPAFECKWFNKDRSSLPSGGGDFGVILSCSHDSSGSSSCALKFKPIWHFGFKKRLKGK